MDYYRLFLTLLLSITMSLLVAGSVFKFWYEYDLKVQLELLEQEAIIQQKHLERQFAEQQRNAAILKRESKKVSQIRAQKQKTCDFWRSQYNKTRTRSDKVMRDTACKF